MVSKTLKAGDKVKWDTSQGETHGTVVKKETGTAKVKGHTAKASKAHPEYRVKSAKSGKEAIHRPEELRKG
jgi:plastocyanin